MHFSLSIFRALNFDLPLAGAAHLHLSFSCRSYCLFTFFPVFCGASHSVVLPVLITRDACVYERVPSAVVFGFSGVYDVFRFISSSTCIVFDCRYFRFL